MIQEFQIIKDPAAADLTTASAEGWHVVSVAWYHTGNMQTALLGRWVEWDSATPANANDAAKTSGDSQTQ